MFIWEPKVTIDEVYQHFKGKFPNVEDEVLYKRLSSHYEGGLVEIWTIEDWEEVLNYKNKARLRTLFRNWEEYFKYGGDYKKHPDYLGRDVYVMSY